MGTQIVSRAFMDAYRQAAANAAKNGGRAAASHAAESSSSSASASAANAYGSSASAATSEFTRKTGLSLEEALQILNVERDANAQQVQQVRFLLLLYNILRITNTYI